MQYLRSRNSTARANFENGKHDKMPIALKHEVEGNLKKYFDLWLKCGGNWKEIQMHLTYEKVERNKKTGNFAWLREDQIRDQFPKAIAEAYIDQLFEKPGSYQEHPQLKGVREAAIYRVFISAEETGETEESTGVQARSTAALSDASDSTMGTMQSILGNASENEENGTHEMLSDTKIETRTPQEIALEQQEKLRLAEEKKRLLELKRADPMEQAKTWLAKLPTDIQAAKKKLIEITSSSVPSDLASEYRDLFDKHEKDLQMYRAALENELASTIVNSTTIQRANSVLVKMRADVKTWNELKALYNPDSKK